MINESILDNQDEQVDKAEKKIEQHIAYKKFKDDVLGIFDAFGLRSVKSGSLHQNNPALYSNKHNVTYISGYDGFKGDVESFDLVYCWENDYTRKYGMGYNMDSFKLHIDIWNDTELGRPRYRIRDFELRLPATRKGGYDISSQWKTFGAKKVTPEFYDLTIKHIRIIVKAFMDGKTVMDKVFNKNGNPQKTDFNKACKLIFGNLIKDE